MALVSGIMRSYRALVEDAFREFLLGVRFVAPLPNIERYKQLLTRIKEKNPDIMNLAICRDGLPAQWCVLQMTRGPLVYNADEHEFRTEKIRRNNPPNINNLLPPNTPNLYFEQFNLGFAQVQLSFTMFCNNDSSAEEIEELYYRRLYKIRMIDHIYIDLNWRSRCDHSVINDFTLIPLEGDQASGWMMSWTALVHAKILMKDIEGRVVDKVTTILYDRGFDQLQPHFNPVFGPQEAFTLPAAAGTPTIEYDFTEDDIDHVGAPGPPDLGHPPDVQDTRG